MVSSGFVLAKRTALALAASVSGCRALLHNGEIVLVMGGAADDSTEVGRLPRTCTGFPLGGAGVAGGALSAPLNKIDSPFRHRFFCA